MNQEKFRVLVFPCGSECGLEIGRSLTNVRQIELWGGSSVPDHGKFVYERYLEGIPFVSDANFLTVLNEKVESHSIDYIYPAMDSVIAKLAECGDSVSAKVIGVTETTSQIALSKKQTYEELKNTIRCPHVYKLESLTASLFPVFLKPDVGYGSQGVLLAHNRGEVEAALKSRPDLLILENLPGDEFTVDCFSNFEGELLFSGARRRNRVSRGVSVNTTNECNASDEFRSIARKINNKLNFSGAWFFQVKRSQDGELTLLEIATRVAGSMGLHRCKGVNLPLLSVFNAAGYSVKASENNYDLVYDRALYNRVKISKKFTTLYVDFDDCLLLEDQFLNADLVKLIIQCRNKNVPVILISRHQGDLESRLAELAIRPLFSQVIHLTNQESKADYMSDPNGFLIDDSFSERTDAGLAGIPSLGPESTEALLD